MGYLLTRIRRELEERWCAGLTDNGGADDPQGKRRMLLVDFDDADWRLGEAVTIRRVSMLGPQRHFPPLAESNFCGPDAGGLDAVILCLQPAWLELEALWAEARRGLRAGGRLLFCTFGPDTLAQLLWAWQQVDDLPHVHPFTDMHIIGDQLLRCGFARPIVDVDRVTVEYADAATLYADLRGEGFTNIMAGRRKTLTGKARFDGFQRALESLREPGGPLAITYELVYGVAEAPQASAGGVRVAPPQPAGKS